MRVLLVTDSYAPQGNGVAVSVRTLARTLSGQGHAVAVYTVRACHNSPAVESDAFPIVRRPAWRLPLNDAFSVAAPVDHAVTRLVEDFQPDIIHCHSPFGIGWQGLRAGLARGIPLLGTHHTLYAQYVACYSPFGRRSTQQIGALFRRYVAAFYNRCDLVTCASRFLALDLMSGGMARPLHIVPNAVDVARFAKPARSPTTKPGARLLFCGRLAPEKNLLRLLELVEPALGNNPALTLHIVGDGPLRRELARAVHQRALDARVVFTGWLEGDALVAQVAEADISVSASLTENQPLALLESMAAGVPVVALAAGGVGEIVRHGETGYAVDPQADPGAFTAHVERLVADAGLRAAMGTRARLLAAHHSATAHAARTLAAYEETAARARWRQIRKSPAQITGRGITGILTP
ncbi:MAG TPA: glycosyltransferase [Ktedonobacterales bacterium]|nr:glycosyltransferase [Ktedonobacterales bacterium]